MSEVGRKERETGRVCVRCMCTRFGLLEERKGERKNASGGAPLRLRGKRPMNQQPSSTSVLLGTIPIATVFFAPSHVCHGHTMEGVTPGSAPKYDHELIRFRCGIHATSETVAKMTPI